jgi:hypothetical protein
VRSIAQGGAIVRTRALVQAWDGCDRTPLAHGERGQTIAPGGAIIRFLSRFGTLEESSANDRLRRCDRLLPQNAIPHLSEPRN